MAEEIELKLAFEPGKLEKLRRNPLIRSLAQGRAHKQQLVSTYFDTPGFALRNQGMALRVRDSEGRRLQTLKARTTATGASNGLHHYAEFEEEVSEHRPDLARIEDTELRERLEASGLARELGPVFTTRFQRTALPLTMVDSEIELALDEGAIEANGRQLPICEAELELKSGKPGRILELALMLAESVPFKLELRTKAERGYGLYEGHSCDPVKGERPTLNKRMTTAEGLEHIARACLDHMRANEAAVRAGGDPEGVHQMRVAMRRLRALLGPFRPILHEDAHGWLKSELKFLQGELGPARDLDVFAQETLGPLAARLPSEPALQALEEIQGDLREAAYARAREMLDNPRYTMLVLRLSLYLEEGTWLKEPEAVGEGAPGERPLKDFASAVLEKRYKKMKKRGKNHKKLSERALHRLRLEGKKMRYAAEFFGSLYPKKAVKAFVDPLIEIQDCLGALNDALTGQELMDRMERALEEKDAAAAVDRASAGGILQGWYAARIDDRLADFPAVWGRFREAKPFWPRA